MKCKGRFKDISLYIDGRYPAKKALFIEKHISECVCCRELLEDMRSLRSSLDNLAPVEESEGFDLRFNRLLDERLERHARGRWRRKTAGIIASIRDSAAYQLPAAARAAASFLIIISVIAGMRLQAVKSLPVVEFSAGNVRIYRPASGEWIKPAVKMRLTQGDEIHVSEGAIFDISSKGKYKARIKGGSVIMIAKLRGGWRAIDTIFDISYGELLVNTSKRFKGSAMGIDTTSCEAEIVGTAFAVQVVPEPENKTWLGVLEGKVKVTSRDKRVKGLSGDGLSVYVSSGQKTVVRPSARPTAPELFSEKEWRMMQELYQLAESPRVMLLIGTEPDRVDELLMPAPVYISGVKPMRVPKGIERLIYSIAELTREQKTYAIRSALKELEGLLEENPSPAYGVEILMFIASHYHYIGDYENAIRVFKRVIIDYPDASLASLAQCAVATIYRKDLKNINKAEKAYRQLLESYPNSVDAVTARENLR